MVNILLSLKLVMLLYAAPINGFFSMGQINKTDSIIRISGRVLNAQTQMPVKAKIVLERMPDSNNIILSSSDSGTGEYELNLFNTVKYAIEVRAQGYITYSDEMAINASNPEELVKDILLIPDVVGQILRMNKLFFQQSTAKISENSFEELNSLYRLLQNNATMIVQLEGHTDFRGNQKLNMKLSQERVEEVKKYLVKKGIAKSRIKLKAFGGTIPLTNENTEEAQQMNRRVEVRILKK